MGFKALSKILIQKSTADMIAFQGSTVPAPNRKKIQYAQFHRSGGGACSVFDGVGPHTGSTYGLIRVGAASRGLSKGSCM